MQQYVISAVSLLVLLLCTSAVARAACVTLTGAQVIVWHAGSISTPLKALETDYTCATGIAVSDHSAGSLDMLRQVTAGGQAADIVAPADNLDIDLFLKPAGYADYDIRFAQSKIVLAYLHSDVEVAKGYTISDGTTFNPPDTIPNAAADWYDILLKSNITTAGSHLYLDPSGYRAPMIFQLAQDYYKVPNLYNDLLEHFIALPADGAPSPSPFVLGTTYDFSLTYESGAASTAKTNPDYRYVNLPDKISLGNTADNDYYARAVIVAPGLYGTGFVPLPASRVTWGVTIMKNAPDQANAVLFLQYLLGSDGQGYFAADGPTPITPAEVTQEDYRKLPASLKSLVTVTENTWK
jgi:molybdate/tungstate transport system substrate-binding protein